MFDLNVDKLCSNDTPAWSGYNDRARISEEPVLPKSVTRPVELQVIGNTSLKHFRKYLNMQVKNQEV